MKLHPGDIIIDKAAKRTLTILEVNRITGIAIGNTNIEYDYVSYMSSDCPQGQVLGSYDYEFDSWTGIEVLKANL
jgi:hypothetical protein